MDGLYIVAILLQLGVIFYFVRRSRQHPKTDKQAQGTQGLNDYERWRHTALHIKPADLKLAIPANQLLVYGVIMDWNMGDVIVTLSAYITGAANMYLSSGGSITGGGKNPVVGEAAVDLVTAAQYFTERSVAVTTAELPTSGCIRFTLLTNHGTRAVQEQMQFFENESSSVSVLFEQGNKVLLEIRK